MHMSNIKHLEDDFDDLQQLVETIDNNSRRYNVLFKRVKEGTEGPDLVKFMAELCVTHFGTANDATAQVISTYRVGGRRQSEDKPRDVVVHLSNWHIKTEILTCSLEKSGLTVGGASVSVFPDISFITLRKRRYFHFLTRILRTKGIKYKWGFPL